ncbi:hypothetical protein GJAV_G00010960 [Gymnothorax javanicus]|nr:hypothetical protein GJAV_G00010960 [Gymnothorax javanicus]
MNVACWILSRLTAPWWSTLGQPPDPRSSTTCLPSGGWWKSSQTWPTFYWSTLMRLIPLTSGQCMNIPSKCESTAAWRNGSWLPRDCLSVSLCLLSASLSRTAWTTTPTWPTVCPLKGSALCRRRKLLILVGRDHFFTI